MIDVFISYIASLVQERRSLSRERWLTICHRLSSSRRRSMERKVTDHFLGIARQRSDDLHPIQVLGKKCKLWFNTCIIHIICARLERPVGNYNNKKKTSAPTITTNISNNNNKKHQHQQQQQKTAATTTTTTTTTIILSRWGWRDWWLRGATLGILDHPAAVGQEDVDSGFKSVESCHWLPRGLHAVTQWVRSTKNRDLSTGPLARPFARTSHSFACSRLLAPSAALTRSLTSSIVGKWIFNVSKWPGFVP